MKQIHLKLLLCLLLIICTNGQSYSADLRARNYQRSNYVDPWGNQQVVSPYGSFVPQPFGTYYGVGYGQPNNLPQTYFQQGASETKINNINNTTRETDASISAYDNSVITAGNSSDTSNICYSIVDAAYPLFSDYCSPLPQTTFSLPNFFGHKTKEELATLFYSFEPTLYRSCMGHLPKFLCPLFFPPCNKEQVLPCAKLCRDVKYRCGAYDFIAIDCDKLPEKSDFCPNFLGIADATGFSGTYENYQAISSNQQSVKTLTNKTTDKSSSHSSSIQISSIGNAGRTKTITGQYGEGENLVPVLEITTQVPKTTPITSGFSNLNNLGTFNQQSIGGDISGGSSLINSDSFSSTVNIRKGGNTIYDSKTIQSQEENSSDRNGSFTSALANKANSISSSNDKSQSQGTTSGRVTGAATHSSSFGNSNKYVAGSSESVKLDSAGKLSGNKQFYGGNSIYSDGIRSTAGDSSSQTGSIKTDELAAYYGSQHHGHGGASSGSSGMKLIHSRLNGHNSNYDTSGTYLIHGSPFGLQTTVKFTGYIPEKVNLSRCGPLPPKNNPCVIDGSQFYELPGYPHCYIHCMFGFMTVRPCPYELTWNPLVGVCDWPTVAESSISTDTNSLPYGSSHVNYEKVSSYSYERQKRSLKETKTESSSKNPFESLNRLDVPLGPPVPNTVPLPGFSGPIGIAGPFLPQPSGAPTAAPPMQFSPTMLRYMPPMFDPIQSIGYPRALPTIYPQVLPPMHSQPAAPAAPETPKPPLTLPLPPPVPPPIHTKSPPLPQRIILPPVTPRSFPSANNMQYFPSANNMQYFPSANNMQYFPSTNNMQYFPFHPMPGFARGFMPPAMPGSTPKLPPFMPPILPTVPIPLGGPLLPPLPMKIPATYIPGPPPIFSDEPFGPFDMPSLGSEETSNGPQVIFRTSSRPGLPVLNTDLGPYSLSGGFIWDKKPEQNDDEDNGDDEDNDDYNDNGSEGTDSSENKSSNGNVEAPKDSKTDTSKGNGGNPKKQKSTRRRRKRHVGASQDEDKSLSMKNAEPSPCIGKTVRTNIPHPTDPTKYVLCLNENKYEIMDCPTGFVYHAETDRCERLKVESICEQQQPCLNNGQCHPTSSTTFMCICQGSWTGERCEIPLSPCASNPCGQDNECIPLVTNYYNQNYICICDKQQSYGSTCEHDTVPNPCRSASDNQQQYYSFAFDSHAYIKCNGDSMNVELCAPGLKWNQETKGCDPFGIPTFINPTVPQSQSYQTNYRTNSETRFNPQSNDFSSYFMNQLFNPYSNYYSQPPSYPFRTYGSSSSMYPQFLPHQWVKENRRLRNQRKFIPQEEHESTEKQGSLDSDEELAQSYNSVPQNPYSHGSPRNLYELFQMSSSYKR